jgi:hypothetical protein
MDPTLYILNDSDQIQISVHPIKSNAFIAEIHIVFPTLKDSLDKNNNKEIVVISTMKKALMVVIVVFIKL